MGQRIWQRLPRAFKGIGLGWSKALWMRFAIAVLLILIVPPLLTWALGFKVNNVLLWVTGLILLVYTLETQEMRRQMVLQNEIAIQPLVLSDIGYRPVERGDPPYALQVILRNIGRGPALFVQLRDIEAGEERGVRYVARFTKVDYIEAGGERVTAITLHAVREGEERPKVDFAEHLDPRYANHTYEVTTVYEDINGQRRESVVRMGKGGIRLLKHGKA